MTAEPDALRLVPVEPTEAMLWRGFDAKGAMTGLRHIHLIYRAMLAAAPAVQPAAGREALSKIIRQRLLGVAPDDQDVVLEDDDWRLILAALSAPQAAPGEGEQS